MASGLSLIFGVMNVINTAHGAFLILSAFLTYSIWTATGLDPLVAILITTPAMFGFGWLLYSGSIRRIREAPAAASVLLTFSLALVLEGLMGLIWGNTSHAVRPAYFNRASPSATCSCPKAQVYGCLVAIAVLIALWLFLARTWTGRAIRASAVNPQGARLVGVNVAAVATMTFAIGVATTGAGGSIVGVLYPFLPGSHYLWISRLLGIIVLGGMGSLPGAVVGALADRGRRVADEHLHLAAVDDRGALRRDLPRAARAPAGAARRAPAGGRRRGMRRVLPRSPWTWLVVAFWVVLLLFPVASSDLFFQNMIILSLVFAIGAVSLNIISGYGGYVSLGQSAFLGIGAYTVGLLSIHVDVSPFVFVPLAGVVGAVFATLLGVIAMRTRGHAFVILTIAFLSCSRSSCCSTGRRSRRARRASRCRSRCSTRASRTGRSTTRSRRCSRCPC